MSTPNESDLATESTEGEEDMEGGGPGEAGRMMREENGEIVEAASRRFPWIRGVRATRRLDFTTEDTESTEGREGGMRKLFTAKNAQNAEIGPETRIWPQRARRGRRIETKNSGSGVSPLSECSGSSRYSDKALASFATGTGFGVATFAEIVGGYRRATGCSIYAAWISPPRSRRAQREEMDED